MRDSPTKASQYLQNPAKSFVVWCFCIALFADTKLEFQGFCMPNYHNLFELLNCKAISIKVSSRWNKKANPSHSNSYCLYTVRSLRGYLVVCKLRPLIMHKLGSLHSKCKKDCFVNSRQSQNMAVDDARCDPHHTEYVDTVCRLANRFSLSQATASTADTSLMCSQTSENQSSLVFRCHRHPSSRWSPQTVFPQNPAACQWHSQPHLVRGVRSQRTPQGLWET